MDEPLPRNGTVGASIITNTMVLDSYVCIAIVSDASKRPQNHVGNYSGLYIASIRDFRGPCLRATRTT